jgi:hypothetical protein
MQSYRLMRSWESKTGYLTTKQKREARAFLFGCFGQKKCYLTGKTILPQVLHDAYDIHHLVEIGQPGCNLLINLRLALHGPNANAGKPGAQKVKPGIPTYNKNKEKVPVDATTLMRQQVDYSEGTKTMQVNGEAEIGYRNKLWALLNWGDNKQGIPKSYAIYGLAEAIGVSPQATRDYYMKITSEAGPMEEFRENGMKRVRVRESFLSK